MSTKTVVIERCQCCGKILKPNAEMWLELSTTDGKYYKADAFPSDHESQGFFAFGKACARKVVSNDGIIEKEKKIL